jgi:signal transduction histidine kinase
MTATARSSGRPHAPRPSTPSHHALEARARDLAEANTRLEAFASTVAHDLMQPVAALAGFLSLLDHGLPDLAPEHRSWLEGAIRGKDRVVRALDALHRHAAAQELSLEAVDLRAVIEELAPSLVAELGHGTLEVGPLPVVEADAGLVGQVVANLLQNAGRYRSPDRPLMVHVNAVRDAEAASWVVSVSDTGRGIAPDELEAVFAPGTRGTAAVGTTGSGTGLATVRSLMARMGGQAWAEPARPGARICLRFRALGGAAQSSGQGDGSAPPS